MDTQIATFAVLAVEQTVILVPSRAAPPSRRHRTRENMGRLPPGNMMDADIHLTFV
jgi:hypothetical protein